jgi:uncharacterized protein (TIGR02449 family)
MKAQKSQDPRVQETDLEKLEAYLEELIGVCERLVSENRTLRAQHAVLMEERARLQGQADKARVRLESTIARLRGMELD